MQARVLSTSFSLHQGLTPSHLPEADCNEYAYEEYIETWNDIGLAFRSREQSPLARGYLDYQDRDKIEPALAQQELDGNQLAQEAYSSSNACQDPCLCNDTGLADRSNERNVIATEGAKYPSAEDWENIKPIFTKLYSAENRALKDVKTILEQDHGFVATERMYKGRINGWDLHKNLKKAEKANLIRKVRQTRGANPLLLKGRSVPVHRLLRYCKENKVSPGGLEAMAHQGKQRRLQSLIDSSSHAGSAAHGLQELLRTPSQPARPIAIHGNMRTTEIIVWNTEVYLNEYFTSGLGTHYFKPKLTLAAHDGYTMQSRVLVKNKEAWDRVVNPFEMSNHVQRAFLALQSGFTQSAVTAINEGFDLLEALFKQQTPILVVCLIEIFETQANDDSKFARTVRQFILEMGTTLLGGAHPFLTILNSCCTIPSKIERFYAWRVVTDSFSKCFGALEDPQLLQDLRWCYFHGLKKNELVQEARDYLDVVYSPDTSTKEQDVRYTTETARFLRKQHKFIKAEVEYRKVLELLKEAEYDILEKGPYSHLLYLLNHLQSCLNGLAITTEQAGRTDKAQTIWERHLELVCAVYGPAKVEIQVIASYLDDFLNCYGYIEEGVALRAQFPCLLDRNVLPPESL